MFTTGMLLFLLLCAAALIIWGIWQLDLPNPVKVGAIVIAGLFMIGMIYNFVQSGRLPS